MKITLSLFVLLTAAHTFANDAFSGLSTGGIEFKKSNSVSMENEELSVAIDEIKVAYDFLNTSKTDEKATVSFPFPAVEPYNQMADEVGHLDFNEFTLIENSFEVFSDGKKLSFQKELKATKDGKDVSGELKTYGLDLTNVGKDGKSLEQLDKKDLEKLIKAGLVKRLGEPKNTEEFVPLAPQWKIKMTLFWEQNFPAGKHVHVEHKYKPSHSSSYLCLTPDKEGDSEPKAAVPNAKNDGGDVPPATYTNETEAKFCVDKKTRAGVDQMIVKDEKKSNLTPNHFCYTLEYILTSANTWAGPIKNFHLILKKPKDAIVSTCFPGIKKTFTGKFESKLKNFTPDKELEVLFVSPDGKL